MLINDFLANIYLNYFGALSVIMPNLFLASQTTVTDEGLRFIGAGLAIIGVLGAGIGQGNAGAGACMAIGRNPEAAGKITTTMVISAGIAESGAIYALLIAILILFAV